MFAKKILKNKIDSFLKEIKEELTEEIIENKVDEIKAQFTNPVIFQALQTMSDDLKRITFEDVLKVDFKEIQNELETIYSVVVTNGFSLVEEDPNRDSTWWTGAEKQKNELFYWKRYKRYLERKLPKKVIINLDEDTDIVMNHIENPEVDGFNRLGMVIGHVQSGKTGNFTGLLCKAADAGYKFIIVIAGGMNNLRNQTQERIEEGFIGLTGFTKVGVGLDIENNTKDKRPVALTKENDDFNSRDAKKAISLHDTHKPMVMVIKKNNSILKNVIKWLNDEFPNEITYPLLVIDDESDYASINTNKEDQDPTAINNSIRRILGKFKKSSYVAYTATPYANIFIDHNIEGDLFPKDFIHCLEAPSNYFGASKIFKITEENQDRKHIIEIDDNEVELPLKHKIDHIITELPNSLKQAVRNFLLNIGIRCLRGDETEHNSMLVHTTRFTRIHEDISNLIEGYLEKGKKALKSFGVMSNKLEQSNFIRDMKKTYDEVFPDIEENFDNILEVLTKKVQEIMVRQAHQKAKIPLEYRNDRPTYAIVVGGLSLARGFTLEGLSVSYFLRTTMFYDTLMQMGRWFGYRIGYEDLCKIYMTGDMADNFEYIINATEELVDTLSDMNEKKKTPKEFGLAVRTHPESALQVTSLNKQRNAQDYYIDMSFNNTLKQTTHLVKNENEIDHNYKTVGEILNKLPNISENIKKKNNYVFRNIDKKIIYDFIDNFKVFNYKNDYILSLKTHLPVAFMLKDIKENDLNFDVAFISGEGEPIISTELSKLENLTYSRRALMKTIENSYRIKMLSNTSTEKIGLTDEALKIMKEKRIPNNSRREIRKFLKRPLLFIFIVETKEDPTVRFPAYGVVYPNSSEKIEKFVRLKINSVYLEELLEEEELQDEY